MIKVASVYLGLFSGAVFSGQTFMGKATAFFTPQDPPIRVIQSKHMLIPNVRVVSLAALPSTPPTRAAHGRPGVTTRATWGWIGRWGERRRRRRIDGDTDG